MKALNAVKILFAQIYEENIGFGRREVVKKCQELKVNPRTAYYWIAIYEKNGTLERKKGSGRPVVVASKKNVKRIRKYFENKVGVSQRKMARKLKCHPSTINRILKRKTGIVFYKRKKKPKLTEKQKREAKPKCRKMYDTFSKRDFVLDDESYFTLSGSTLSGNRGYYTSDQKNAPDDVKHYYKSKYEEKVLVWVAISPKGISSALFRKSGLAVNSKVYLDLCILKRLVTFLNKHYKSSNNSYVFWPDLASSHYAKVVQSCLKMLKIDFVPKSMNPANMPQVRPIEDFWAHLKTAVYDKGWAAKNVKQLKTRIEYKLRKINLRFVQHLASSVNRRLRNVIRHGI